MSGEVLLDEALAFVRAIQGALGFRDVREYGGEFTAAEVDHASYNCPAVFITMLGSRPALAGSKRLTGRNVRIARMAAFVATKGASRDKRMREAMVLSERLAMALHDWKPEPAADKEPLVELASPEDEPTAENLYGRAIDKEGQALWLLTWQQAYRPLRAMPQLARVTRIDILDHTRQGLVPAPPAPPLPGSPGTLRVTEEVRFEPLPPA